jgi:hypothetical protein
MAKKVGWQLDLMPEKMMALAKFHGSLLTNISEEGIVGGRIKESGARIVARYFESYLDAVSKIDPYRYHHVYEFGMTGNKSGRLFKSTVKGGSISYSFTDSKVPNENGQVFVKKAFIMESGQPLVITPKSSEFLAFEIDGEQIFARSTYVQNPGGPYVAGSFRAVFEEYFKSRLPNNALRDSGFYDTIEQGISEETMKVSSRISAGAVNQHAQQAAQAAYGIAGKVESNANRL